MLILAIETSCDETAVALYGNMGLLGELVHSQQIHTQYAGVVPELAARDHVRLLLPQIEDLLQTHRLTQQDIGGIAYTAGPGLVGPLLVGSALAKALAFGWQIPALGIHHLEGHLLAPFLSDPTLSFPFLALLVSGGHTLLVDVQGLGCYEILGQSVDDAAGEAFDKTAKLLGLDYPGGAKLAALATQGRSGRFQFPRPMPNSLNFSFSGLKTHTQLVLQATEQTEQDKADIALAFEEAVVDTLRLKCERALMHTQHHTVVVSGGVGANQRLRQAFHSRLSARVVFPPPALCTDNAAMIAYAGYQRLSQGQCDPDQRIRVQARWPLQTLIPPCQT